MTLAQLLVVQAHDSAIDRHVHTRANLPEFAVLSMLDDEQAHLEGERSSLAEKRHEISREQKRFEDDAAIVTDRIDLENERLYNGTVTAIKDLQALQTELVNLGNRRSDIEDQVLMAMEQGEPLDIGLAELDEKLVSVESRRGEALASLAASQAAIDAEIELETSARETAVAEIDAALVTVYETSRADSGGVGICRLIDKTCEGCHLQLPAVELDRVRKEPDDAIVRCVECSRILVR